MFTPGESIGKLEKILSKYGIAVLNYMPIGDLNGSVYKHVLCRIVASNGLKPWYVPCVCSSCLGTIEYKLNKYGTLDNKDVKPIALLNKFNIGGDTLRKLIDFIIKVQRSEHG